MFTLFEPAKSVGELIEHLKQSEPQNYLFRGQVREFPNILPSRFRGSSTEHSFNPLVGHIPTEAGWVHVSNEVAQRNLDERGLVKQAVRSALMKTFGKGIGNILAQQYGLGAEVLDFTDNPSIAGFFATRRYPTYEHFNGNEENGVGVIYRLKRWPNQKNILKLEENVHAMQLDDAFGKECVWFKNRIAIPALEAAGNQTALKKLEEYFHTNGEARGALQTAHARVSCGNILKIYRDIKKINKRRPPSLKGSRLQRQRGGFVYPIILHDCRYPTKVKLSKNGKKNEFFADPNLIAIKDILAIHDAVRAPEMEAFYFEHSEILVNDFSKEFLWPSIEEDEAYRFVADIAQEVAGDYLKRKNTDLHDPLNGLLDRGFE